MCRAGQSSETSRSTKSAATKPTGLDDSIRRALFYIDILIIIVYNILGYCEQTRL